MQTAVVLLRAVNVVGRNKIRMEELRRICAACGFESPRTYLQSGNAVARVTRISRTLAATLESAIEAQLGFRPAVILRSARQIKAIAAAHPFDTLETIDPSRLAVYFLDSAPSPSSAPALAAYARHGESIELRGTELFVYFPAGFAESKLTPAVIERILQTRATARNWNTVTALARLAQD